MVHRTITTTISRWDITKAILIDPCRKSLERFPLERTRLCLHRYSDKLGGEQR